MLFIVLSIALVNLQQMDAATTTTAKMQMNISRCTLTVGRTYTAVLSDVPGKVVWSSGNSEIASVRKTAPNKGRISALKAGTTYIYAKVSGKQTCKCKVIVRETAPALKLAVLTSHTGDAGSARAAFARLGVKTTMIYSANVDPSDYDGLVIPGGADINPARYGQGFHGATGVDYSLDNLQFAVTKKFVNANKPIFGICRGLQLINVYFGGTLHQHINNHRGRYHGSTITRGSQLYELYGSSLSVLSFHHQAANKIGKGLKVTQKAAGGYAEGLEHESLPIIVVQWHPEHMGATGNVVLRYFMSICRKYRDRVYNFN
mgnify:CR=1 FL=1